MKKIELPAPPSATVPCWALLTAVTCRTSPSTSVAPASSCDAGIVMAVSSGVTTPLTFGTTGGSFTGAMLMITIAVLVAKPSLTVYGNDAMPL